MTYIIIFIIYYIIIIRVTHWVWYFRWFFGKKSLLEGTAEGFLSKPSPDMWIYIYRPALRRGRYLPKHRESRRKLCPLYKHIREINVCVLSATKHKIEENVTITWTFWCMASKSIQKHSLIALVSLPWNIHTYIYIYTFCTISNINL